MKIVIQVILAIILLFSVFSYVEPKNNKDCMWCTIIARGLEQFILYNHGTVEEKLGKFCDLFDKQLSSVCHLIISIEGKALIELLEDTQDPDVVCREVGLCHDAKCNLYHKSSKDALRTTIRDDPWWKKLLDELMAKIKRHTPIIDLDNDLFSPVQAIRGSLWRGKDCNDYDTRVYPGRRQSNLGAAVDHNCNGIAGADKNNVPYEELYCRAGTNRGVVSIGDSGSAHFRIPEQLFDPAYMNFASYKHILRIAETEADWPHLSWGTGYFDQDDTGLTPGPVDSIYKRMRDHNRCIHRDYQNIAVNGASSNNVMPYIQQLSRNQTADEPLLVMYALIGNDVCGETPGLDRQTKPAEFYANVKKTLDYLETRLPPNSFVAFVGLAAGDYLYKILQNATHPLGVTYEKLYTFQNCLVTAPCWGWMSQNETIRDLTTKRAIELSAVYPKLVSDLSSTYKNFKMAYHDFPMKEIAEQYAQTGKPLTDLIEPFDGFHPSQTLQSLMAKYLWEWLASEHPEAIGAANPNNAVIDQLFGNQGGY